jgi:hypothetical protein
MALSWKKETSKKLLKISPADNCDTVTIGTVPYCTQLPLQVNKKWDGNCSEFHQLLQRTLAEKKWAVPTIRQPVKKEIRSGNDSVSFF